MSDEIHPDFLKMIHDEQYWKWRKSLDDQNTPPIPRERPRHMWIEDRIRELCEAIGRYAVDVNKYRANIENCLSELSHMYCEIRHSEKDRR